MKRLLLFFLFFFAVSVFGVVIIPPLIYVATFSALTFAANLLVGFGVWLALQGIAQKRVFNRRVSALLDFAADGAKTLFVGLAAAVVGLVFVSPLVWTEILFAAGIVVAASFVLFFLLDYKRWRGQQEDARFSRLGSFFLRSLVIGLLVGVSVYGAIELRAVSTSNAPGQSDSDASKGLNSILPSMGSPSPSNRGDSEVRKAAESPDVTGRSSIWVQPLDEKGCVVSDGIQSIRIEAVFSCVAIENNVSVRVFCPFELHSNALADVTVSGACRLFDPEGN